MTPASFLTCPAKSAISVLLIITFSYSTIRPIFPFLDYIINYEYITQVLCINKENQVLQCNGKCHLTEEVLENKTNDEQDYPTLHFEKLPILFFNKIFEFQPLQSFSFRYVVFSSPIEKHSDCFVEPLIPPPRF